MSLPLIPSSREISTTEPFLSSVVRYLETTDSYKKHTQNVRDNIEDTQKIYAMCHGELYHDITIMAFAAIFIHIISAINIKHFSKILTLTSTKY